MYSNLTFIFSKSSSDQKTINLFVSTDNTENSGLPLNPYMKEPPYNYGNFSSYDSPKNKIEGSPVGSRYIEYPYKSYLLYGFVLSENCLFKKQNNRLYFHIEIYPTSITNLPFKRFVEDFVGAAEAQTLFER